MGRYPISSDACIKSFTSHLETETALSPRTIKFYAETQHAVMNVLEEGERPTLPYSISEPDIRWLLFDEFPRRNFSFHTQKGYIFALNQIMRYYDNNAIGKMHIRWPNSDSPNVDWLTFEQSEQLLLHPMDSLQALAVHFELCLGLRRGECLSMKLSQIEANHIRVLGKGRGGGKWRPVPFHRQTAGLIDDYLADRAAVVKIARKRRPSTQEPEELFIANQLGGRIGAFSSEGWGWDRRIIIPLREALGFHFSNHTLRRTFGRTMYYVAKVDIVTLARIMGHESTAMTLKYIGTDTDEMSAAMAKSPF